MNHKPNKITRQKMNRTLSAPSCPRTILDSYSSASEHSQQTLANSLTNSDTATENQAFEMTEKTDRYQVFKILQCNECEKIEIENIDVKEKFRLSFRVNS
ncbi:hypothetical protein BpHYR1_000506 [Brachionus plicatilis]|uniref:Uncharacterized protein n=1 Tax=Brachionus plicatilis TaxID=10195 RepID=A0A3M7R1Z5_BRAPC|nr:hypothetical protein BpHYR1_000506 [Brachionus plicatilis]